MKQSPPKTEATKLLLLLLSVISGLTSLTSGQASPARLTIISIRQASGAGLGIHSERERRGYVVRFRLEIAREEGLYALAMGPLGTPLLGWTHERARTSGLNEYKMSIEVTNLCLESDDKSREHWVFLPGKSAYEWEMGAMPSQPGTELSRSVCVRRSMRSHPGELLSSWYTVGVESDVRQQ